MKNVLRLNLGSGKDYIPDWVNVDITPEYTPDVIADLTKPLPFDDNSAAEIKAHDILEHFTKEDGLVFIDECWRVLKNQGFLKLRLPNVFAIHKKYSIDPEVMLHFIYGDTAETGVFGSHKAGYTEVSLRKTLAMAGFTDIMIKEEDTNFTVSAKKDLSAKNKPITIGIIQQSPDMGGAETYMISLIQQWMTHGDSVIVATSPGLYYETLKELDLNPLSYKTIVDVIGDWKGLVKTFLTLPYSIFVYVKLIQSFKKRGVDCVLMSEFSERLVVAPLLWVMRMPVVWIEYARPVDSFKRNALWSKILFRLVKHIPEGVVTPTEYAKQSLMLHGRVSLSKIHVIPCGTEVVSQKSLSSTKKIYTITCISRLTREKGQEYLIAALPKIRQHISAELLIVGSGPDRDYFEEYARKKGVAQHVRFLGYVDSIQDIFKKTDVCVFPTVWPLEGFGLVIIEAMAHGIPVVAADTGPVAEVVRDAGVCVKPASAQALADAIVMLMQNTQLRKNYIEKGYSLVRKRYNIKRGAQKIHQVLAQATV